MTNWQIFNKKRAAKLTSITKDQLTRAFITIDDNYSMYKLSGKDSHKLLQNTLTIDIDRLDSHFMLAGICNQQGKLIASIWVAKADDFLIYLPSNMQQAFQEHLRKYLPLYQASITDESEQYLALSCHNHCFPYQQHSLISKPQQQQLITKDIDLFLHQHASVSHLPEYAPVFGRAANLAHGLVEITPQISNKFTPNHLEYDKWQAISYTKGCYLGQEIIARIHYRTKLQTKIQTLIAAPLAITPGEKFNTQKGESSLLANISLNQKNSMLTFISKHTIMATDLG